MARAPTSERAHLRNTEMNKPNGRQNDKMQARMSPWSRERAHMNAASVDSRDTTSCATPEPRNTARMVSRVRE